MKMLQRHIFGWGILGVVFALYMASFVSGQPSSDDSLTPVQAVSKSNVDFSRDFYQVLRYTTPGNLVCSPLSLSAVIAMVKGGARGNTAAAIKSTLYFPEDSILFSGYKSLLKVLKTNENFTLEIANRVYAKSGFEMNPDFVNTVTEYFNAEVEQIDFTQARSAANKINSWVETVTRNKITNLISPGDLDALTRLVLVNGIYFKGKWKTQFDKKLTKKDKFYTDESNSIDADMMNLVGSFHFADLPEIEASVVSLPYQGDRLSMIVLLPNKRDGLKDMENLLKDFDLATLASRLRKKKIALQMPKFKLESTLELKDPLTTLGLGTMFDQGTADFSGIPNDPTHESLYVSKAIQKAFIEVNEEGSEAAAATGFQITMKSATLPSSRAFVVDHSFVTFILDMDTGIPLFMTTVVNPKIERKEIRTSELSGKENEAGDAVIQKMQWSLVSLGFLYALQLAL